MSEQGNITNLELRTWIRREHFASHHQFEHENGLRNRFMAICQTDEISVLQQFLNDHGQIPNILTAGLRGAVRADRANIVEILLEKGGKVNSEVNIVAVMRPRDLSIFKILCHYGWDINTVVDNASTALLTNIENEELVRWLFDNGATVHHPYRYRPDGPDLTSGVYLDRAAQYGSIATLDMLIEHGADLSKSCALHFACMANERSEEDNLLMMVHLLDLGFDVNGNDDILGKRRRGSPLNRALLSAPTLAKIKFLLENGANPFLKVGNLGSFIPSTTEEHQMIHLLDDEHKHEAKEIVRLLKDES